MAIKNEYVLNFKSQGVKKTKQEVDNLNDSENKLGKSSLALKASIAAAGIAIVAIGKHAISTASQFESLKTRLRSMYGSVNQATKAFETFQRVAATTPFAVKNVVEAGASLKAFGVDAENNIKAVADLAAFMGVDVVEAAQAMGRAFAGGAGAADVLRERGILTLIKDFKGIEDLTKLTLPEFRQAMIETIQDPTAGVAGATTLLSETFEGSYSNMMDSVDRLSASIGDKLLPIAKSFTDGITNMINGIIGTEDAITSQISALKQEENAIRVATNAIIASNLPRAERNKQIRELQREYPEFLSNIDAETLSNSRLRKELEDLNKVTQLKIDKLIQEQLLNETLEEQTELISNITSSYTNAQNFAIQFGENATKAFSELDGASKSSFQSIISDNQEFADAIGNSGRFATNFAPIVTHIAEKASELFSEFQSGNLTMDQYTEAIKNLSENKAYQNMLGEDLTVTQQITQEQDNFKTSTEALNGVFDTNATKLENIKNNMSGLKQEIDMITDPMNTFLSLISEKYGPEPLEGLSGSLEKVDTGLSELPESTANSLKGAAKFSAGMKAITKDLFAQDSAIRDQVIGSMGAIAMASAGSKAEQLKVQKMMVKANVAKGIIDIFTDPTPTTAVDIAKAVALSASLVARGVTQTKTIDEQIANINATKGSIGQTSTRFAQYGMNEVVDQATPIIAGEAGAELVQITPLEGANVDGPQGGGSIVITGNVLSRDFVQGELIDELREAIRQGYDFR